MSGSKDNLIPRSPVVVVMGHVDHGKTSLLDYIRKTSVADREKGGITQAVGAYEVEHNGKRITFIDTPGHEAFTKMRARGAHVADVAILVVAADDGVKPQTEEAIKILQESKTPFVVAFTKIDKDNANVEKAKNDLMAHSVLLEGLGGSTSWQEISNKSGQGINELLDLILLTAEVEEFKYDPEAAAQGYVIESEKTNQRGSVVSVIVKEGVLRVGDDIKTPLSRGKVKILENFLGGRVKEITPSAPAIVCGFEELPQAGEEFVVGEKDFSTNVGAVSERYNGGGADTSDESAVNIILKANVSGSLEALLQTVRALPVGDRRLEILAASVGDITDGDVKAALASKSPILGFNVKVNKAAENLAQVHGVKIFTSGIIYELVQMFEGYMEQTAKPQPTADLEILKVFNQKQAKKQLVGGKVVSGVLNNNSVVEIKRGDEVVGKGRILNLQKGKEDAVSVPEGSEGGLLINSNILIEVGDHILTY